MKLEEAIEKLEKTIIDHQKEADRSSELVKWLKDYKKLLDEQNKQCQTCGRFIVGDLKRCPTCLEVLK